MKHLQIEKVWKQPTSGFGWICFGVCVKDLHESIWGGKVSWEKARERECVICDGSAYEFKKSNIQKGSSWILMPIFKSVDKIVHITIIVETHKHTKKVFYSTSSQKHNAYQIKAFFMTFVSMLFILMCTTICKKHYSLFTFSQTAILTSCKLAIFALWRINYNFGNTLVGK